MAGERSEIVSEIREAFASDLSDAVIEVTFTNLSDDTFDPITGTTTETVLETAVAEAIASKFWQYEPFNSNIEPTDEGLLVVQDDLTLVPRIGTKVSFSGRESRIVEVKQDPMDAIWELRIRY